MKKISFLLYCDWQEPFNQLSDENCGKLIKGIFKYVNEDIEPQFHSPELKIVFSFIKSALDRDKIAYREKCKKNKDNGKLGGRPKKEDSLSFKTETENKTKGREYPPIMLPRI